MFLSQNLINQQLAIKLNSVLNWDADLPENVFREKNYDFFIFERPIIDQAELLENLMNSNSIAFGRNMVVFFGNPIKNIQTGFEFTELFSQEQIEQLRLEFRTFFNGQAGYPVIVANDNLDWIAYESAREELGILAVKKSRAGALAFIDNLETDAFVSYKDVCNGDSKIRNFMGVYRETVELLLKKY